MKYGETLIKAQYAPWAEHYLQYDTLKKMLKELRAGITGATPAPSISILHESPGAGSGFSAPNEADFSRQLELELDRVNRFATHKGAELRKKISELEEQAGALADGESPERANLQKEATTVGDELLRLEKFVNVNLTGFHKILKKHDKHSPMQIRSAFTVRLWQQPFLKNKVSDIVVRMSRLHDQLRQRPEDVKKKKDVDGGKQTFVRKTTKYWVHLSDVTAVKFSVLRHLPILQSFNPTDSDAQLVSSVYLDNTQLELFHDRLNKRDGAIAIRLRWYGGGEPSEVFVERKVHRDSWTGDVSVKTRFSLKEKYVLPYLQGKYTLDGKANKMRERGVPEQEVSDMETLAREIQQAVDSKQLVPTMRTSYTRTAFQLPFDASVRISLDTNLCMITENVSDGEWKRPQSQPVTDSEICRFEYAVLEVKLKTEAGQDPPQWVTDLQNSGLLTEVPKFSKFIHGTVVLLGDQVRELPHWINNEALPPTSARVKQAMAPSNIPRPPVSPSHRKIVSERTPLIARPRREQRDPFDVSFNCFAPCIPGSRDKPVKIPMRVEPKTFFANERTFLNWMSMSVLISTIALAMVGFADSVGLRIGGIIMMGVGVAFIFYAFFIFRWRAAKIRSREAGPYDDVTGPTLLVAVLVISLGASLFAQLAYEDAI